jgi:hypothetical protein
LTTASRLLADDVDDESLVGIDSERATAATVVWTLLEELKLFDWSVSVNRFGCNGAITVRQ